MVLRWCVLFAALGILGCNQDAGPSRVHLKGALKYKGVPLEVGRIRFVPMPGTEAPATIVEFQKGQYDTHADEGKGVPIGQHRVEITAYTAADYAKRGGGPFTPPPPQILPAKYNESSTLVLDLSGTTEAEKVHDFDLEP